MLVTQILTTAFIIVGCCIVFYIIGAHCYCAAFNIDFDEDRVMDRIYTGVGVMSFIFMLILFSLICELTLHLIS